MEKSESITSGAGESSQGLEFDPNRLQYARVDGPSVIMAYMTEDKNYVRTHSTRHVLYFNRSLRLERASRSSSSFSPHGAHGQRYGRVCIHNIVLRERTSASTEQRAAGVCGYVTSHFVANPRGVR